MHAALAGTYGRHKEGNAIPPQLYSVQTKARLKSFVGHGRVLLVIKSILRFTNIMQLVSESIRVAGI